MSDMETAEQLRAELTDARAARDALARAQEDHKITLTDAAKRVSKTWLGKAQEQSAELAQMRDELAAVRLASKHRAKSARLLLHSRLSIREERDLKCRLAKAEAELADANEALDKATIESGRWQEQFTKEMACSGQLYSELQCVRQDAQDWRNEVGELWLNPAEAEGLRRRLGVLQSAIDNLCEQQDRQLDMEECGARCSYPSKFPEWKTTWEQAYELRYEANEATARLSKRLEKLDAAEAALASCGMGGIFAEFDGLADAIEQMAQHIKELTQEPVEVEMTDVEMAEALRTEVRKRVTVEADTHTLSKALDECTQTVHIERQLRHEAEQELRQRQQQVDLLSGAELRAHQAQRRAVRAEAELDETSGNLKRMVELNEWSRNELDRVNERAKRAEALAALVTPELAAILERLGTGWTATLLDDGNAACTLAAEIREALIDDSKT